MNKACISRAIKIIRIMCTEIAYLGKDCEDCPFFGVVCGRFRKHSIPQFWSDEFIREQVNKYNCTNSRREI